MWSRGMGGRRVGGGWDGVWSGVGCEGEWVESTVQTITQQWAGYVM